MMGLRVLIIAEVNAVNVRPPSSANFFLGILDENFSANWDKSFPEEKYFPFPVTTMTFTFLSS